MILDIEQAEKDLLKEIILNEIRFLQEIVNRYRGEIQSGTLQAKDSIGVKRTSVYIHQKKIDALRILLDKLEPKKDEV